MNLPILVNVILEVPMQRLKSRSDLLSCYCYLLELKALRLGNLLCSLYQGLAMEYKASRRKPSPLKYKLIWKNNYLA